MHRTARRRPLLTLTGLLAMMILVLAGGGGPGAPAARAETGRIVPLVDSGSGKNAWVTEYGPTGRLYLLWSEVAGGNFALKLAESAGPDGAAWNGARGVNSGASKPNLPRIQASPADGRLHAVWAEDAGDGSTFHAWFTPGAGKSPADPGQWQYETVSTFGKNPTFDIDPAGNAYIAWEGDPDGAFSVWGRRWDAGGGALGPLVKARAGGRLPGVAATGDGLLHLIFIDRGDRRAYYRTLDQAWNGIGGETPLSSARAEDIPQIAKDAGNGVHMTWTQESRRDPASGRQLWEIYYAQRPAGGAVGPVERVSTNLTGGTAAINHGKPTVAVDDSGASWVA